MFRILIVDDDDIIRRHVRSVCKRSGDGVAVLEASDSQQALSLLEENIVQLCIMDLHLPDMLGTELLKIVKQQYGGIKVIMLSGDNSFDAVRQAFVHQADDYLEKPIDEEKLLAKLVELRKKFFFGLKTIELPKKPLSAYIPLSLNAEFAALGRDSEEQFNRIKKQYSVRFDEGRGVICSMNIDEVADPANTEYYYSFLAERVKQDFSECVISFLYFGGRLLAVLNFERLDGEIIRRRLSAVKDLFNENNLMLSAFISVPFEEGKTSFYEAYRSLLDMQRNVEMYGRNEVAMASGAEAGRSQLAIVQRAKRYIQDMIFESFSLVNVAEYLNIHPNYLSKVFKQSEGISFTDYVCDCKMKEAKYLLTETNMKIYAIAEKLHYYDTGYFIRIFKKYYGVSPNQFRQHLD